jgi:hypothetical protein
MEVMNKKLLVFGCILLAIGLIAYFYRENFVGSSGHIYEGDYVYPYQTMGMILTMTGIVLTALSLVLPENK